MRFTRVIAAVAFCLTLGSSVEAQFLDMGVGARPMGMGRAFVAVADDASAMYWNAAGISQLRRLEGIVMYAPMYVGLNAKVIDSSNSLTDDGMALAYGAVVLPTSVVNVGASVHVFNTFLYNEYRLSLGFARFLGATVDGTGIGISGKFKLLGTGIATNQYVSANPFFTANGTSKQAITADLGLFFRATERLSFGASWENIIPADMSLSPTVTENVPFLLRMGAALKWPLNAFDDFRSAIDVTIRNNTLNKQRDVSLAAGAEVTLFQELLAFRSGFNVSPRYLDDGFSFDELTFGMGYRHTWFRIDYTMIMARNLSDTLGTHMFSIGLNR